MNTALLLHSTEELELCKMQKRIIKTLKTNDIDSYPHFPLQIPLTNTIFNSHTLKEIKSNISQIKILNPQYKNKWIYFPIEIKLKTNLTITEELKIVHTKNDITNFAIFEQLFKIKNPLKCRVFKIANISFSGFSWTLSNEQWIKAK